MISCLPPPPHLQEILEMYEEWVHRLPIWIYPALFWDFSQYHLATCFSGITVFYNFLTTCSNISYKGVNKHPQWQWFELSEGSKLCYFWTYIYKLCYFEHLSLHLLIPWYSFSLLDHWFSFINWYYLEVLICVNDNIQVYLFLRMRPTYWFSWILYQLEFFFLDGIVLSNFGTHHLHKTCFYLILPSKPVQVLLCCIRGIEEVNSIYHFLISLEKKKKRCFPCIIYS